MKIKVWPALIALFQAIIQLYEMLKEERIKMG
jgi:hypothetical protein